MTIEPVFVAGQWRVSQNEGVFQAENPALCEVLPDAFPISSQAEVAAALAAAGQAFAELRGLPAERIAQFLERFAASIEGDAERLVEAAHLETAYPREPRLAKVELPRTVAQLRQAAAAAREGSWAMPTIDTANHLRSCYAAIGPVVVFGPNNFPFAFNSAAGGDFAAAIAAGNPVIAKANTSHPATTKIFAELAGRAVQETGLPAATVQMIYRTSHETGERWVADHRVGAVAYTGSRAAGLKLKAAADAAGVPIYLELSAGNPVVILPGALQERAEKIAEEFQGSCLLGSGQFCTNPGLVLLIGGPETEEFIAALIERFYAAPVGTLLSRGVAQSLERNVALVRNAGAELLVGGTSGGGVGYSYANTLLRVDGKTFLTNEHALQTEMFGNASLVVVACDFEELLQVVGRIEGSLTGCVYSSTAGDDDELYDRAAFALRQRVGRLLNDAMPTGVAVSPAMNHGGPYPSTGHPGFTAVGIPASLRRFAALHCYDRVREHRLPPVLRDENSMGAWRLVDGTWSKNSVGDFPSPQ